MKRTEKETALKGYAKASLYEQFWMFLYENILLHYKCINTEKGPSYIRTFKSQGDNQKETNYFDDRTTSW